ncbi:hypothetical protein [Alkalimarinus sediminis]|uniref:Uncharacterized protein n=1 Tax=Alkalimarinus sediminis TaxID=1632866 RepID=A0A9E8HMV7_9ALTE|nr:hypothetical protein [Alkalimarinus sediminis]UZW75528.1 hypothetical protein NNL22_02720 [Alkalimarinus sediminis]
MNTDTVSTLIPLLAIIPLIANIILLIKVRHLNRQILISHNKTIQIMNFLRNQSSRKVRLKTKQAIVEKTVNSSTVAVENIHQSISGVAFNAINNLATTDKTKIRNQKLRALHDQTSSDVYKSVKVVNKQLGAITNALLSTRKPSSPATSDKQSDSAQQVRERRKKRLSPKR